MSFLSAFAMHLHASHWLPFTFLMELQLSRVSTLVFIFSILCLSHYIAQLWRSGEIHRPRNGFLTGAFFISVVPVLMPPAWLAGRLVEKQYFGKRHNAYTIAVAALCLIACGLAGPLIGLYYGLWSPGLYIYPRSSTWIDVQLWAQAHTPKEAVFITPPQLIGPFEPDWRVFSERTTLATFTELLEVALDPDYLETWQPRFTAIAPGAIEQFDGDYFKNKVRIANAFYSLSEQAILSAACRFGADYLVMEKPHPRAFPIIYENLDFVVYDLRQLKSCSF